jgi:hypothetical protein
MPPSEPRKTCPVCGEYEPHACTGPKQAPKPKDKPK